MAEASVEVKKTKKGVKRIFGFGKKKKKPDYCPYCAQKSTTDTFEEKHHTLREESKPETYQEAESNCKCTRCSRQRGEDPLTVELLPMDTQVTLQNSLLQSSLQDAGFMCCIL